MPDRIHLDPAGFGIHVPPTWQLRTDAPGLAVVALLPAPNQTRDNVGVIVEAIAEPTLTLEQYVAAGIDKAPQSVPGFHVVDHGTRRSDNATQAVLEFTGRIEGDPKHFLAVIVLGQARAFSATFAATEATFDQHRPAAEPVLYSLFALTRSIDDHGP